MSEDHMKNTSIDYEKKDAHVRTVTWIGIWLFVFTGITIYLMIPFFKIVESRLAQAKIKSQYTVEDAERLPPDPVLEIYPNEELKIYRRQQKLLKTSYGYIDKTKGIARIPLEKAVEDMIKKGFPSRK